MLGIAANDNAGNKITKKPAPLTTAASGAVGQMSTPRTPAIPPYGQPTPNAIPPRGLPQTPAIPPRNLPTSNAIPPLPGGPSIPTTSPYAPTNPYANWQLPYGTQPSPQAPGGREYGSTATTDPYLAYLNGQGQAIFGEQGLQNAYADSQFGNTMAGFGLDRQDAQARYAAQMAGLNGQMARNDITRQGNLANIGFADRGLYGANTALGAQRNFNTMDADQQRAYAAQLGQLASQQFGLGKQQNQFAFDQTARSDRSDATSRGAVGSLGFLQDNQFNSKNLALANSNNQLGYDSSRTNINNSLTQGLLGIDRANAGLDAQGNSAQLSHDQKVSDAQLSNDVVDSLAKEYGVTADQLGGALDRGLQRIGLTQKQATDGLAEAKRQGNAQAVASWTQILQEALGYSGQSGAYTPPPAFMPSIPATSTAAKVVPANVAKIFGPAPKPAPSAKVNRS